MEKLNKTEQKQQTASIQLCVELDSLFKLYSYRIIDHQQFSARTHELVQFYKSNIK